MPDIQQQMDLDKAREKLDEVGARKENQEAQAGRQAMQGRVIDPRDRHDVRPVKTKPKKKGFGEKMKEAFFGDIGDGTITEHIFFKIFIPSFKRVLADMGNSAINMALGLDPKTRTLNAGSGSHAANQSTYRDRNYNRSYTGQSGYARREAVSEYYWDEETAKDIYNQLNELIDHYGYATLEDAYSIMDMPEKIRSTDRQWGWTSMRAAEVYAVDNTGERWVVDMPAAKPI